MNGEKRQIKDEPGFVGWGMESASVDGGATITSGDNSFSADTTSVIWMVSFGFSAVGFSAVDSSPGTNS